MNYYGYEIILQYSNEIFIKNLYNIKNHITPVKDLLTEKLLYTIDLLNHNLHIIDIVNFLLSIYERNLVHIHMSDNININLHKKNTYKITTIKHKYPFLVIKNQQKKINFSIENILQQITNISGEKWKI